MLVLMESEDALQDALAFIDAFEASSSGGDADASSGEAAKPTRAPPRRKKRSHTERVKTELEQLRNDAEALEATLKRLKQHSVVSPQNQLALHWSPSATSHLDSRKSGLRLAGGSRDPVMTGWMEVVVEEYRRRRESETLNLRLRAMLDKQVGMVQASESALSSKFKDADLGLLYKSEQPETSHTNVQERALAKSLSLRAQQLLQDVDNVLKRTGLIHMDSFLSWSQRKHDGNVGVFFESTYCLPVPFNLEQTNQAFITQTNCTSFESMIDGVENYLPQSMEVKFQHMTYDLSAKSTVRMIQENDRVVYVWTSLVSLPSEQWTFVEDSIVVVRRADTDSPTSLVQNWHRVWMEEKGPQSASAPLKETILSSLGNRVRDHMRTLKSSMEETRSGKLW